MIESTFFNTLGFHNHKTIPGNHGYITHHNEETGKEEQRPNVEFARLRATSFNALQIMGYLPSLSIIPCAVRLIYPLLNEKASMHNEPTSVKVANYVRGAFEGFGCGSLFLIPDVMASIYRFSLSTSLEEVTSFYEKMKALTHVISS